MGLVKTHVYWPTIQIPQFNGDDLKLYSLRWRQILSFPEVGLLKPESSEGDDVLIVEHPIHIPAASAYGVVIPITWSKLNPDFTLESQTISLLDVKTALRLPVENLIVRFYFPDLIGVKYAVNVWLQRLDGGFAMI